MSAFVDTNDGMTSPGQSQRINDSSRYNVYKKTKSTRMLIKYMQKIHKYGHKISVYHCNKTTCIQSKSSSFNIKLYHKNATRKDHSLLLNKYLEMFRTSRCCRYGNFFHFHQSIYCGTFTNIWIADLRTYD